MNFSPENIVPSQIAKFRKLHSNKESEFQTLKPLTRKLVDAILYKTRLHNNISEHKKSTASISTDKPLGFYFGKKTDNRSRKKDRQ